MLVLYYSSTLSASRKGHSSPGSSREAFWPIVCKCLCRERRQPDGARDVALRGAGGSHSRRPGGRLGPPGYTTSAPREEPGDRASPFLTPVAPGCRPLGATPCSIV